MRIFNKFRDTKGFISTWERVIRFRYMITKQAKERRRRNNEREVFKYSSRKLDEGIFGKNEFVREMKEKFEIRSLIGKGRLRKQKEKNRVDPIKFSSLRWNDRREKTWIPSSDGMTAGRTWIPASAGMTARINLDPSLRWDGAWIPSFDGMTAEKATE